MREYQKRIKLMFPLTKLDVTSWYNQPENVNVPEIPIDNFFPEEAANKLATLESFNKHLYRPNTYREG
jgi:hypothetical protein